MGLGRTSDGGGGGGQGEDAEDVGEHFEGNRLSYWVIRGGGSFVVWCI